MRRMRPHLEAEADQSRCSSEWRCRRHSEVTLSLSSASKEVATRRGSVLKNDQGGNGPHSGPPTPAQAGTGGPPGQNRPAVPAGSLNLNGGDVRSSHRALTGYSHYLGVSLRKVGGLTSMELAMPIATQSVAVSSNSRLKSFLSFFLRSPVWVRYIPSS